MFILFQGGVQTNVIPDLLTVVFDVRIATTVDVKELEKTVTRWCKEAGDDVYFKFEQKNEEIDVTKLDSTNPYWVAFKKASDDLGINLDVGIFPGATDSRYIRAVKNFQIIKSPSAFFFPRSSNVILYQNDT